MADSPVMADTLAAWLTEIRHGNIETYVMAEGKRYNFNCDRNNHYVYEIDGSSREPKTRRKKRRYIGVIASARANCPAQSERWERVIHPANCPDCTVGGNYSRLAGAVAGFDAVMAVSATADHG